MSLNHFELVKGVVTRLKAVVTEVSSSRVYSYTPPNTNVDHIRVGNVSAVNVSPKGQDMQNYQVVIDCYTFNQLSHSPVSAIMKEVYDALHRQEANVTITGYTVVNISHVNNQVIQEGAGVKEGHRVFHGIMTFEIEVHDT